MSRIDEALRRAANGADTPTGTPEEPAASQSEPAPDGGEIASLSREPFPIEMSNRGHAPRVPRPAASPAPAGGDARDRTRRTKPSTEERSTTAPRADSLFERLDHALAEKVVADRNMSAVSREQYRRLAAALHDAQANDGLSVIMIASAVSGEGKTLTASNLALTLSESYQKRVLLIDADLRKPTLHQVFKIHSTQGLTTGLEGGPDTKLTVHQVSPRLSILPAGRPTSDPMAALISERMRLLIDEASQAFDWVIIDTPPIVLLPDANLLAAMVQGTVLVIGANSTPHNLVKRAADAIGHQRIIGTVLNQAAPTTAVGYGSYYYGSGTHYLPTKEAAEGA